MSRLDSSQNRRLQESQAHQQVRQGHGWKMLLDILAIGVDTPTIQSERRARAKRAANTTNAAPEKQKNRRTDHSSDDNSNDTADEAITPTAKEESIFKVAG